MRTATADGRTVSIAQVLTTVFGSGITTFDQVLSCHRPTEDSELFQLASNHHPWPAPDTHPKPLEIHCLGLGGAPLGLRQPPDFEIKTTAVDRTMVYGPGLCPVDQYHEDKAFSAHGSSISTHELTVLYLNTKHWAAVWANILNIPAAVILHRSLTVLRAARPTPAHRVEPHPQFVAGCFWFLAALIPGGHRLAWPKHLQIPKIGTPPKLFLSGFSAGSYLAAAVAITAHRLRIPTVTNIGAIAMPPKILVQLGWMASQRNNEN